MAASAQAQKKECSTPSNVTTIAPPDWLRKANEEYKAGNAHVFVLHGNVNDVQDNNGRMANLRQLMMAACDDNYTAEYQQKNGVEVQTPDTNQRGTQNGNKEKTPRICAIFTANEGLKFDSDKSRDLYQEILTKFYEKDLKAQPPKVPPYIMAPRNFAQTLESLSYWFEATKALATYNKKARREGTSLKPVAALTVIFKDCDCWFPAGSISSLSGDRIPIAIMRNWAQDKAIGQLNRLFLLTSHLSEVHESLRGGSSGVSAILIPKPNVEDREAFSRNFCDNLARRCQLMKTAGDPLVIDGKEVAGVQFVEGFDHRGVGIQSAGMSREQIEKALNIAVTQHTLVDDRLIREIKQRCLDEEYHGLIEIEHPTIGFDKVGGHEEIKEYCRRKVIGPLQAGDARVCSKGFMVVGPGGTGKTWFGKALAFEAHVNFLKINLSKLFDGIVGGTEQKTAKLWEACYAAAPCIAFFDEFDTVMSQGRVSHGDSGTSSRMFGSVMQFLGDDSRAGKIVVMAATNRPDILDPYLIRAGRIDAILPMLAPPAVSLGESQEKINVMVNGRMALLQALVRKLGIRFDSGVMETTKDPMNGLGKLVLDENHIWTGAEIENVLKEAIDNALYAKSKVITLEHWNEAIDSIIPNTGDVERITDLSLYFCNNKKYCPPEYRDRMADKANLMNVLRGGTDYRMAA